MRVQNKLSLWLLSKKFHQYRTISSVVAFSIKRKIYLHIFDIVMSATVLSVNPSEKTLGEMFTPGGTRVCSCPRTVEYSNTSSDLWTKMICGIMKVLPKRLSLKLQHKIERRDEELTYDVFRRRV